MESKEKFTALTSLIGEPVRATMLWNLLDGKAFTATELAINADVSAQSASMHLAKLIESGILKVESQGRHKYYRFARPDIAYAIEALANLVPHEASPGNKLGANNISGIKYCRTCYDHLAGKVGVAVTDAFLKKKLLLADSKQFQLTKKGERWFEELKIKISNLRLEKRSFARPCLDWSERKHHLAGALGAALLKRMLELEWVNKVRSSRELIVSRQGQKKLNELLGIII